MNREQEPFVQTRLVCADCGHEIEDDEIDEQRDQHRDIVRPSAAPKALLELGLLRCLDCGSSSLHEVDVDLRDVLLRAAQNMAEAARVVLEQRPSLRGRVERTLAEARADVEALSR